MAKHTVTRRRLIQVGALGLGSLATSTFSRAAASPGANERIRVGIIGPGERGRSLMGQLLDQSATYNAELVAVCDLWNARREQAAQVVRDRTGRAPAQFRNVEELFGASAVDAVIIATPDFSHAILCADAIRAGLDVYVEKPLAHLLEEAKLVRQACRDTGRVVQIGTDGRSLGRQRAAAEFVRAGRLGKVVAAEMGWHVNEPFRWRRDKLVATLKESDTDWKRYQLNRPARPFDPRRYLEFRLFWPYSSGLPDQWLSHHVDAVAQVTGELYPAGCVASSAICQWHDGRENGDTFAATFQYASGLQFSYSARHTNAYGGHYGRFFSNSGMLDLMAGTVSPEGGIGRKEGGVGDLLTAEPLPDLPDESHVGNWLACIRTRRPPAADINAGYAHSVAVSMAVRALQTGRRVSFDPATEEFRS